MPIVLKSGSLNLLEPYERVQACNGIALTYKYEASPSWELEFNRSIIEGLKLVCSRTNVTVFCGVVQCRSMDISNMRTTVVTTLTESHHLLPSRHLCAHSVHMIIGSDKLG
jgi:hypothetical protein